MKRRVIKLFASVFVLGALVFLLTLWQGKSEQGGEQAGTGISLIRPAFAQGSEANFLEQEAGIAAYTNLDRAIDLTRARTAFKTVEKETGTYIVGSFSVSAYEGYGREDVHCFVHKDGWVVVYYLEEEPTAKMIHWQKISDTKLSIALVEVCNYIGVALPYVRYYHFKYPDATKLMVIAKWQSRSFRTMIPSSFIVYERSWSTSKGSGAVEIDETRISKSSKSGEYGTYGLITFVQLKQDTFHTINPTSGNCALALVYRES